MFDFLQDDWLLTGERLHQKVEYYIDGFLAKQSITMWYAKPGQGKTWFSLAIAKYILDNYDVRQVIYMDFDNARSGLAERNVEILTLKYKNFKLLHRSTVPISPQELHKKIVLGAFGENYKDCVFIYDAARDFVDGDMDNDTKVRALMESFKNIREAGGTVCINHHATKNGKNIDGSGEFEKSLDALYRMHQNSKTPGLLHLDMINEKPRLIEGDSGFTIATKTLELRPLDERIARIDSDDKVFIDQVKDILAGAHNGLGQSELLTKMGLKKSDRPARAKLEAFSGTFWNVTPGARNAKVYNLI